MDNVNRELGKELYKALRDMQERNKKFEKCSEELREKHPELAECEVEFEDGSFKLEI